MSARTLIRPVLALALATAAVGCGDVGEGPREAPREAESYSDTATASDSPLRGAMPGLFSIMLGLQTDMAQVSRGIWLGDHDLIAAGAQAVADHPTVPPAELARISEALGEELPRFKAADMHVHDLAVQLAERARASDMAGVLATDAELRAGCVACHDTFRARLRQAIDPDR